MPTKKGNGKRPIDCIGNILYFPSAMSIHPVIQVLLDEIDAFMARSGITPTDFGLSSIGDPNLYGDLKKGRSPRLATLDRIRAFMGRCEEAA
ncbi:hypothetical protein [Bradyrhizobium sp. SZCCHNR2032]|uniref:hypothetical protein n=1 Tax=Bradyrhizobium sp. SZCCHNR2032 TaxID=3057384 RepID=UPI002917139E|nr:hypothetical protein [Bradyrhizobium sp. SZCCHNR2032]